ncbi:MAG: hypothetical protein KGJ98_00025 [Chloroflexota bacterium]|nr:hypothetical protein [Chloroflexota bacterium]MDE3100599.1 hypothetical protein [Chloroflexota bacterium]
MFTLKVVDPVAPVVVTKVAPAPRAGDLAGKRVGLYWNMKGGGDVALQRIEQLLSERYSGIAFSYHQGDVGAMTRRVTKGLADTIAASVDALIGTTAD